MKGAIQKTETAQDEFLSCNFYCERRRRKPSCDKSEKLNIFILYEHFQMEVLHFLKFLLEQNDYLYKIDLKDAYSTIPLSKQSSKCTRFRWSGNLNEFLCLCFALGLAPKMFTKLLKIVFDSDGCVNFSVLKFWVCCKYEKSNSSNQ